VILDVAQCVGSSGQIKSLADSYIRLHLYDDWYNLRAEKKTLLLLEAVPYASRMLS
jgi:hypothetical protein